MANPRSTKAGPAGPATPGHSSGSVHNHTFNAQRRPARPGRQLSWRRCPCRRRCPSLNEGRPGRAGNSVRHDDGTGRVHHRSTKAGPAGPATPFQSEPYSGWLTPLNEGRPGRAGNSGSRRGSRCCLHRSTKAGPAGPATHDVERWRGRCYPTAQRRPARPGRQLEPYRLTPVRRYTAQRRPARPGRQLRRGCRIGGGCCVPLNEGRPGRAGNSSPTGRSPTRGTWSAQRRPARPGRQLEWAPSMTPPPAHAQRRPARPGRQLCDVRPARRVGCDRSTKAGPAGPATREPTCHPRKTTHPSLNEGRPGRAGNSPLWRCGGSWSCPSTLNEGRPGRAGNSSFSMSPPCSSLATLNEGRPGRAGNSAKSGHVSHTSRNAQRRPARPGRQLPCRFVSNRFTAHPRAATLNEGRPGRAGNSIRRSPRRLGVVNRSTKGRPGRAGNSCPCLSPTKGSPPASLNEGRPGRAGNSRDFAWFRTSDGSCRTLNEGRPGRAGNSGQGVDQGVASGPSHVAQRRPARPGRQLPGNHPARSCSVGLG